MAKYTKPELINYVWASDALPANKPSPDASGNFTGTGLTVNVQEGWLQVKPPFEVENWIQNQQSQFSAYINQMGIPEWDGDTEYQSGKSLIRGSNNKLYTCIQTHSGRNPASGNPSYWEEFEGTRQATTSNRGTVELATSSEARNASGGDRVVRSSDMDFFRDASNLNTGEVSQSRLPNATSSQRGIAQLATDSEVQAGNGTLKIVTPAGLSSRTATTSRTGLVELATDAEAKAGTSDSLAVTPSGLRGVLEVLFPVDSVVMRPTNPANSIANGGLGFGSWTRISGRTLVGAGSTTDTRGESRSFTTGQTSGEFQHVLTEAEMPSHNHPISPSVVSDEGTGVQGPNDVSDGTTVTATDSAGGDSPHNNMQPYYVVDMWRRTA